MPVFDPDDPRLTAYALGELDSPDAAEIERLLAETPEAARVVDEVRDMARRLTDELHSESAPGLDGPRLAAIEGRLTHAAIGGVPRSRILGYAVAASVLIATGALAIRAMLPPPRGAVNVTVGPLALNDLPPKAAESAPEPAAALDSVGPEAMNRSLAYESASPRATEALDAEPRIEAFNAVVTGPAAPPSPQPMYKSRTGAAGASGMMGGMAGVAGRGAGYAGGVPPAPASASAVGGRTEGLNDQMTLSVIPEGVESKRLSRGLASGGVRAVQTPGTQTPLRADSRYYDSAGVAKGALGRPAARPNGRGESLALGTEPDRSRNAPMPKAAAAAKSLSAGVTAGKPVDRRKLAEEQASALGETPQGLAKGGKDKASVAFGLELREKTRDFAELLLPEQERARADAEDFAEIIENDFVSTAENPLSTFAVDVDTASYANVRRFLNRDQLPPPSSVRIEELVNYFRYDDPAPKGSDPVGVRVELARCPWNASHRLARIALKARPLDTAQKSRGNLVFLVDVSGSMQDENKLPLLKKSLRLLVDTLGENDRVSIVVYANREGVALRPTSCANKAEILSTIDSLEAGGSTNGGSGIQLAYQLATESFVEGGVNRVILCTDGDFNVGITDRADLLKFIEQKAKTKVFLTVLGFGMGNLKDANLEGLADKGNGHYAYIDSLQEAKKTLVEEVGATLVTVAKDVKIQVDFNPRVVASYRLIGYENRAMAAREFRNDAKDAGEMGAGHTVTALFELVPAGKEVLYSKVPESKYLKLPARDESPAARESFTVYLRWKAPEGDVATERETPVSDSRADYATASSDFKFSAAVASFGMLLRHSTHAGNANWSSVLELAEASSKPDPGGYRKEFLALVRKARELSTPPPGKP